MDSCRVIWTHEVKTMFFKKTTYLEWDNYKKKVDFLDLFYWQQSVRKKNVLNS